MCGEKRSRFFSLSLIFFLPGPGSFCHFWDTAPQNRQIWSGSGSICGGAVLLSMHTIHAHDKLARHAFSWLGSEVVKF